MLKKISISRKYKLKIKNEFGVSYTSVDNALNYYSNSDKAQAIRLRAKELMEEEARNIIINLENID